MLDEIKTHLAGHPWQNTIQYFDIIDSTNTHAKKLAAAGAPEGTVIIADQQTGGRGRLGRSFSSPTGMGIYLSVILRPDCFPEEIMHLTCAAGVAASDAVSSAHGALPGIKWTNDLVLGRRKLGGILTELSIDPGTRKVQWVVVGIGINCCQKPWDFPEEIRDMACSLEMDKQDMPTVVAQLIQKLHQMRTGLFTQKIATMTAFRDRCVTIGQDISILRGDQIQHARAIGVDDDGALEVILSDGSRQHISSGEVSIRGMYGYL